MLLTQPNAHHQWGLEHSAGEGSTLCASQYSIISAIFQAATPANSACSELCVKVQKAKPTTEYSYVIKQTFPQQYGLSNSRGTRMVQIQKNDVLVSLHQLTICMWLILHTRSEWCIYSDYKPDNWINQILEHDSQKKKKTNSWSTSSSQYEETY